MEKISKNYIYQIFIIIQPILNILIYFFNNELLSLARPIILGLIFILYLFDKKISFKYKFISIIYLCLFLLYAIIHLYIVKRSFYQMSYGTIMDEAKYLIYYGYYLLLLLVSYIVYKSSNPTEKKQIIKSITISTILMVLFYYISILTNTSPFTYGNSTIKQGWKGWSNSAHHIGLSIVLSLSIVLIGLFENKTNNKLFKYVCLIMIIASSYFLVGTKAATFGTLLLLTFYGLINIFSKPLINNKKDKIFFIITIIVMLLALSQTFGYKNMEYQTGLSKETQKIRDYEFVLKKSPIKENDSSFENRINKTIAATENKTISSSDNRIVQKVINNKLRSISPLKEKLFGYGFQNLPFNMWVETDYYILYYCFGLFGMLLLIGIPVGYLLYLMLKNVKNIFNLKTQIWILGLNVWLNIGIIIFVGYVMYFAQTSIYFALSYTMLCVELEDRKNEKKIPIHD